MALSLLIFGPILRCIEHHIDFTGMGTVRVCADDIGGALASITALKELFRIFAEAARVSGLELNIKKCMLAPTGSRLTIQLTQQVYTWLDTHLPTWRPVAIAAFGKHFGFSVGPAVHEESWHSPPAKWESRSRALAAAGASPAIGIALYNSRAATRLSYIAQVVPPPAALVRRELWVTNKILHTPCGAGFSRQRWQRRSAAQAFRQ